MQGPVESALYALHHGCLHNALIASSSRVQDQLLILGLIAYLDLSDIMAAVGYQSGWASIEMPLDVVGPSMLPDSIARAQSQYYGSLSSIREHGILGAASCSEK